MDWKLRPEQEMSYGGNLNKLGDHLVLNLFSFVQNQMVQLMEVTTGTKSRSKDCT